MKRRWMFDLGKFAIGLMVWSTWATMTEVDVFVRICGVVGVVLYAVDVEEE